MIDSDMSDITSENTDDKNEEIEETVPSSVDDVHTDDVLGDESTPTPRMQLPKTVRLSNDTADDSDGEDVDIEIEVFGDESDEAVIEVPKVESPYDRPVAGTWFTPTPVTSRRCAATSKIASHR